MGSSLDRQGSLDRDGRSKAGGREEGTKQNSAKASYLIFAALTALQAGQDLAFNGLDPKLSLF